MLAYNFEASLLLSEDERLKWNRTESVEWTDCHHLTWINSTSPKNRSTGIGWLLSSSKKALPSNCIGFFGTSASSKLDPSDSTLSQLLSSSLQTWSCRFSSLSIFDGALLDFTACGPRETLCSFSCFSSSASGMLSPFFCWIILRSPGSSESRSPSDVLGASPSAARFPLAHVSPSSSDFTRLFFSLLSLFEGCPPAALCEEHC